MSAKKPQFIPRDDAKQIAEAASDLADAALRYRGKYENAREAIYVAFGILSPLEGQQGPAADALKVLESALQPNPHIPNLSVIAFAKAIEHGDDVHKEWLREAAQCWSEGRELPSPR